MNRRTVLHALVALPVSLATGAPGPTRLPVPGADLAGALLPYRAGLPVIHWSQEVAEGCAGWAAHISALPAPVHSKAWPAQECWAAGQQDWVEALHAWVASPAHLPVLQHTRAVAVGMAGVRRADGWTFWVLRVQEHPHGPC